MARLNKVVLIGNMVADPELKTTTSGISVTTFTIAVQRRKVAEGQPNADYINIVAWRQAAEFVCKHFSKGKPILVCGEIRTRTFTTQQGDKRYITEIEADDVGFVETKSASGGSEAQEGTKAPAFSNVGAASFEEVTDDDNLPF